MKPRTSVIISVFNAERYLAAAIESVLGQTSPPDELIVVDDGSTDGSAMVAAGYGDSVHLLRQENRGTGAGRNRGIDAAAGELVAFLDADDLWEPGKLAHQSAILLDRPELDAVFGHSVQFVSPELATANAARLNVPPGSMPGLAASTMLVRSAAFQRVGRFREDHLLGEFIDWYSRALAAGFRSIVDPKVVHHRRIHDSNLGILRREDRGDYARILKAALDRKRTAAADDA